MNMCPRASRSSRRDCSLPRWVFIDMYLAVPVKLLCSLNRNIEISSIENIEDYLNISVNIEKKTTETRLKHPEVLHCWDCGFRLDNKIDELIVLA